MSGAAIARRRLANAMGTWLLRLCLLFAVAPLVLLAGWLLLTGLPALRPELLLTAPADMMRAGGIAPALLGSLGLLGVAMAVAVPIGFAAAIHLMWYVRAGPVAGLVANLATVPSVIYGLFGLVVFVRGLGLGVSWLAGSLTLAVLMLPLIIQASAAALADAPPAATEASLALGATRWQTIWHIALPATRARLLAAAMLAAGRAAGETAPLLFTAAAFFRTGAATSLLHQTMTLPTHLYLLVTQVPSAAPAQLAGTGLVLLLISLGLIAGGTLVSGRQAEGQL